MNARRVRTFTLFPTNLSRCLVAGASKCDQYSLSNVWPGFNDPPQNAEEAPGGTEHIPVDYPSVADTLRTVLGGLTDLETLEVVSKHNAPGFAAFISLKPRFLDLGWPSFYSTLTALSLNVALDALDVVLPPSDVLLPCLSNFTLDLYPHRTRDARTVFKTILVPFISRHAPTLRFLQLSCTTFIDPYGFLADIPFIPSLSSFSVAVPCADPMEMDFSGLEAFLTLHRETLHHFKYGYVQSAHSSSPFHMVLVPPSPEAWYSQGWLKLSFPNLRVLDLSFHYVHNGCHVPPTITYILQYAHTLRELHLWPFVLSFRHLSDLVKGLAEYQVIESLDLVMSNFNADVLELLAAELPQLVSLSIISPSRAFKSSLGPSSQADDVDKVRRTIPQGCYAKILFRSLMAFVRFAFHPGPCALWISTP